MKPECDFCHLENEPHRLIRQGELATSFLSDPRLVPGHTLIVPNRHVELPPEISAAEISDIYKEAQRLTRRMIGSMAMGVDFWQKTRPAVQEGNNFKMNHVHFHILPSNQGEELYEQALVWKDRLEDLPHEEREHMLLHLRA